VKVVALAGGVGAGKFLRGLVRAVAGEDVTAVVNTGDDLVLHGLHISPDLDSVTYWLAGVADRGRGWGRAEESFRTLEEVRRLGGQAWFALGDLDLATHLTRTHWLRDGKPLSEVTATLVRRFAVQATIVPMSDDRVETWVDFEDRDGGTRSLPFQVYWVDRGAPTGVKAVRYDGAEAARPAPGVVEAFAAADVVVLCPSNPVASIAPILAVPGIAEAVRARRDRVVGISPIVAGAPLRGMADRLMPSAGLEVSALGAARAYRGLLGSWVLDQRDRTLAGSVRSELGVRTAVVDTIMSTDEAAKRLAEAALQVALQ
jgi:LPPG:FO 2-phospho-L-lactate transferase